MNVKSNRYAYVTLVTNEDYCLGALALARSLQLVKSEFRLLVLSTTEGENLTDLEEARCEIIEVRKLPLSKPFEERHSRKSQHQAAPFTKGKKPSFHDPLYNFCKLRLWELEHYERLVFIDADAIVVKDISRLFGYPEFSAAPNLYEELIDFHRLNSGVFVAEPSKYTFDSMLQRLEEPGKFWRRTDQTFLETYFPDWHGLPYTYNTLQYVYFNLPQMWHWPAIKVVHYQYEKPWEEDHPKRELLKPLIDLWYNTLEGKPFPEELPTLSQ